MKFKITKELQDEIRSLPVIGPDPEIGIVRYDEDIYFVDQPVPWHIDNSPKGTMVFLLCIVNDGKYLLQESRESWLRHLIPGHTYIFNGNDYHRVIDSSPDRGRLGFIIWDIPGTQLTKELIEQLNLRIKELENKLETYE